MPEAAMTTMPFHESQQKTKSQRRPPRTMSRQASSHSRMDPEAAAERVPASSRDLWRSVLWTDAPPDYAHTAA